MMGTQFERLPIEHVSVDGALSDPSTWYRRKPVVVFRLCEPISVIEEWRLALILAPAEKRLGCAFFARHVSQAKGAFYPVVCPTAVCM